MVTQTSSDSVTTKLSYDGINVLPYWLNLNLVFFSGDGQNWILNLNHQTSWNWLSKMKAGGSYNYCWCLCSLRPDQWPWKNKNKCFLVPLCSLVVRKLKTSGQEASLLLGKCFGVVFELFCSLLLEERFYCYFWWWRYSKCS